ncbi:actin-related protein 7-like isoform X2 [Zingiber officinale]|uniref:actin-related protein 7-like isoform X2 n=1 Tax=Zingiber officinale TaxID=94328 RepID=UPI001C4CA9A9|nr:actin-related protein 7-like isoform X2 [Zingiber officinale]XP_042451446.1 actin-related protein 7-like isoform X2 [Zingiber officinale]
MEAVVVDAGSKLLKIGFASPDQDPALIMQTKMKRVLEDGDGGGDVLMVEEVTADPVVRGFIRDWDAMEDLLRHVLYIDLGWEVGDEGQILFAEPLFTPKAIREQLVQLMFETFNVSGFYASEQVVLSLYAVGRISGCTVDIGHGKIEDQTSFEETENKCPTETHTLPDGQTITIGRGGYIVGEALFEPSILGIEEYGIVEQLVRSISSVSSENLRQLLENTMLCGGTASMTGFEERFQKEANLCSSSIRPSLIKPPEYMPENLSKNSAWMGGAILAKVVFPQNQHVTRGDYDETGPTIVHKKCF